MRMAAFIAGTIAGFGAYFRVKNKGSAPTRKTPQQHAPLASSTPKKVPASANAYQPKADILISAGPRKSQKDTELGEDVAGTVLTPNQITFWVLDGTSDSDIIHTEKGSELLSSRLLALSLGATLHQLAQKHPTAQSLFTAALESVTEHLQEQLEQQRSRLEQFVATQPSGLHHWQVSTTVLLGTLSVNGSVNLLRVGDSKALCFDEEFQLIESHIGEKPESKALGRLYARLNHNPSNAETPFSITLIPLTSEQVHLASADGVRRVIAFSDGVGPATEQYLRLMLGRQAYSNFLAGVGRTPNRTFDDKTLVLASFEQ